MHHHPLGWIEGKRVGVFDSFNIGSIFRTNKCCPCVGGVDVHPKPLFLTCENKFTTITRPFFAK